MPSAKGGSEVAAEDPRPHPAERGTHKRAGRKSRARSREIRLLFDQVRFLSVLGTQYTLKLVVDVSPGDRVRPADLPKRPWSGISALPSQPAGVIRQPARWKRLTQAKPNGRHLSLRSDDPVGAARVEAIAFRNRGGTGAPCRPVHEPSKHTWHDGRPTLEDQ